MVKKCVAIIPARGGSKRIPGKNIIDFSGKPLIAWTIEAAIHSGIFDSIYVSTDDVEIAEISKKIGAKVPFLRENYADDRSTVSDVVIDYLIGLEKRHELRFENVAMLMPNCPLKTKDDIINSYNNFIEEGGNFQISSFKFGWMNPWWAYKIDGGKTPVPLFKEAIQKRSQDLPDLYCPTGAIWLARIGTLIKEKSFYGIDFKLYEIPWTSAVDIDSYEDLAFAKAIFKLNEVA